MSNTDHEPTVEAQTKFPPILHFYPHGNYVSCNMYWVVGMPCPHHGEEDFLTSQEN